MSGAGDIKDDGSDDNFVFEVKDTTGNYTLNGKAIKQLHQRAVRQGKLSRWVVHFADSNLTADIYITPGRIDLT